MRHIAIALLLSLPFLATAQLHEPVLPGLEGGTLLQSLQDQYRPNSVLPYNRVRDTLFRNIDARNDTLRCVYTDFAVHLPPGEDPTEAAFQAGINTEHTYPRSKGAGGFIPESDMHHLFPTRVNVNADRASFPFAEIP
ncbi:MAG TPA: endonuclease, partial [Phaeodactylibacter sp.]|nr:endonuclease [Phaeodactylibacter sp.]